MPSALGHSVGSVAKVGYKATSVLMSGSHYINFHGMVRMLEAGISHSLWHDAWTNATHDDVMVHIDWMLHNLLLRRLQMPTPSSAPDPNMFALLTYARFAPWLISLPHQLHEDEPAWLIDYNPLKDLESRLSTGSSNAAATQRTLSVIDQLVSKADSYISNLSPTEFRAFRIFWDASRKKFKDEIQRRVDYNRRKVEEEQRDSSV